MLSLLLSTFIELGLTEPIALEVCKTQLLVSELTHQCPRSDGADGLNRQQSPSSSPQLAIRPKRLPSEGLLSSLPKSVVFYSQNLVISHGCGNITSYITFQDKNVCSSN